VCVYTREITELHPGFGVLQGSSISRARGISAYEAVYLPWSTNYLLCDIWQISASTATMEAIAAFGLFSNIVQVIGFAAQVFELSNEFHKHGIAIDLEALDETNCQLARTTVEMETSLSAARRSGPPSKSDLHLAHLIGDVRKAAEVLNQELQDLQINPRSSRQAAFSKAFKLRWRAPRIEEQRRRLNECVGALNAG
jgi:hypothetical protein